MTLADTTLLRVTEAERGQLLHAFRYGPGPYAAILCTEMTPAESILEWRRKVSYRGGRNKAALPRNLQRIADYLQESFLKISVEDSWDIPVYINNLFRRAPSA